MRTIKFRGRRKGGEWLYGDLNHINGSVYIFDRGPEASTNSPDWYEVEPESVGQFTGLNTNDWKEVYEGDIIEFELGDGLDNECGVVRFSDSGFWTSSPGGFHEELLWEELLDLQHKLVGNTTDNPELL